jgi:hypothetical protein
LRLGFLHNHLDLLDFLFFDSFSEQRVNSGLTAGGGFFGSTVLPPLAVSLLPQRISSNAVSRGRSPMRTKRETLCRNVKGLNREIYVVRRTSPESSLVGGDPRTRNREESRTRDVTHDGRAR